MGLSPNEQGIIREILAPILDQLTLIADSLERIADSLEIEPEENEDA